MQLLSLDDYRHAVSLRDLSDPASGRHAMQLQLDAIVSALAGAWGCPIQQHRANPVVPIEDNYDRLCYPADGAAREARHTRYVSDRLLLRTQTSAMVPELLTRLDRSIPDVLLVCPGLVYRRDAIDRLHTGEPHQVDLWRIRTGAPLEPSDLDTMIAEVVRAALPGIQHRTLPATHPYTLQGRQIDVQIDGAWIEIGECGQVLPALLASCGLDPAQASGLAMGLGLDRLLMIRKGIPDVRLLRSTDPRVVTQLMDLAPWRPVSRHPPAIRDLSLVVSRTRTAEELGDRIRTALGVDAGCVESTEVIGRTAWADLPLRIRQRLGLSPDQDSLLLRIVLRHLDRTLTSGQANTLRDRIYGALHEGPLPERA